MAVMAFLGRLFGSAAKKKRSPREADTYRLLAEQSPDVIFRVRRDGKVT